MALLVLTFTSLACDSEEEAESPSTADETESSTLPDAPLEVELQVPQTASPGDTDEFSLVIKNIGSSSTSFHIGGRRDNGFPGSVDFSVRDSGDREVWGFPSDKEEEGLPAVATQIRLAPGEELTIFSYGWDGLDNDEQPIPPGVYTVRAVLLARDDDEQEFTITSETKEIEIS